MAAVSLKNQILKHCGKIHSGIDEEPFFHGDSLAERNIH
jgi:hypothetical protein